MKKNRDWSALLQSAVKTKERRPSGPGWVERSELFKQFKMGRARFYEFLAQMKLEGRVEQFDGQVERNGRLVRCAWYRISK